MSDSKPPGRVRRLLRRPWLLLPVKIALVLAPAIGSGMLIRARHWSPGTAVFIVSPIAAVLVLSLFALYTRTIEGRPVSELAPQRAPQEFLTGFGTGALAIGLVVGIIAALGCYHVVSEDRWTVILAPLVGSICTGVFEELLFRGVLFRIAEDSLGSYWALALTALLFGAAHLFNPHATLLAGAAIMIEAGIFLGAAYMLHRRLWLPIGIHAGWNFTQGGILGVAVSGTDPHGWLHAATSSPVWISGGEFGAESSVIAILVCGAIGIALLVRVARGGGLRAPYWRRAPV
jgi:membrane protease YdiL (CAAX protease family)